MTTRRTTWHHTLRWWAEWTLAGYFLGVVILFVMGIATAPVE